MNKWGLISGALGEYPPPVLKRLYWIGKCAKIGAFQLHVFNNLKGNSSRYFVEASSFWQAVQYPGGFVDKAVPTEAHRCFYLGSFAHTWKRRYRGMAAQAAQELLKNFDIEFRPEVPGYYVDTAQKQRIEEIEANFSQKEIDGYLMLQRANETARLKYWENPDPRMQELDKQFDDIVTPQSKGELLEWWALKKHMDARYQAFKDCQAKKYPKTGS